MIDNLLFLRERFEWMGDHSGYDLLFEALEKKELYRCHNIWCDRNESISSENNMYHQRLIHRAKATPFYDMRSRKAEANLLKYTSQARTDIIHLAYVENQFGILGDHKPVSSRMVGTIHQPSAWWKKNCSYPERLSVFDALILCAKRDACYFEKYLPNKVFFIPHGIDLDFFCPPKDRRNSRQSRCVFVGKWLRDIESLTLTIKYVLRKKPNIQFDIVIPNENRHNTELRKLSDLKQICWHSNLSDDQLRNIYQKADLLLLPLLDCTANNALLEAMACGLPIISNDVGGIRDYTEKSFAELLPAGDIDGMAQAVLGLVENPREIEQKGLKARAFAEENFSWQRIAKETIKIYEKVNIAQKNPTSNICDALEVNSLIWMLEEVRNDNEKLKSQLDELRSSFFWKLRHNWITAKRSFSNLIGK